MAAMLVGPLRSPDNRDVFATKHCADSGVFYVGRMEVECAECGETMSVDANCPACDAPPVGFGGPRAKFSAGLSERQRRTAQLAILRDHPDFSEAMAHRLEKAPTTWYREPRSERLAATFGVVFSTFVFVLFALEEDARGPWLALGFVCIGLVLLHSLWAALLSPPPEPDPPTPRPLKTNAVACVVSGVKVAGSPTSTLRSLTFSSADRVIGQLEIDLTETGFSFHVGEAGVAYLHKGKVLEYRSLLKA